jgi:ParB family chromosome partitioning protein
VQAADLADSYPGAEHRRAARGWRADMPLGQDDDVLWDWLHALDEASRQALLAHCLSFGVNALYERPNPYSGMGISQHGLDRRLREADRLARTTRLDLVEAGWKPTVANYLGRVTKSRILEAVREGRGEGCRATDRPSEEGRHGARGRTAPRRLRLAARAASAGRPRPARRRCRD